MVNRWTIEETKLLKTFFPIKLNEELLKLFPKHPVSSIKDKASELKLRRENKTRSLALIQGIGKAKRTWSKEEDIIIRKYFSSLSMEELGKLLLNRTKVAIYHRGVLLGLNRPTTGRFTQGNIRSLKSRRKQAKTMFGDNNVSKKPEIRKKISLALKGKPKPSIRGEKHFRWTGGREEYYGFNWDKQRRLAREGANYKCQICGCVQHNEELCVHHIIPFRKFGLEKCEEANKLSNLVALCRSCHSITENKTGWR